jgi:hypothetical protein
MAPRAPSGDVDGVPAVHRVLLGGRREWDKIEGQIVMQLENAGVRGGQLEEIYKVLRSAYLKWRPETALLISQDDQDAVLPVVEDLAHRENVTVNGLIHEILKREIRGLPAGEERE